MFFMDSKILILLIVILQIQEYKCNSELDYNSTENNPQEIIDQLNEDITEYLTGIQRTNTRNGRSLSDYSQFLNNLRTLGVAFLGDVGIGLTFGSSKNDYENNTRTQHADKLYGTYLGTNFNTRIIGHFGNTDPITTSINNTRQSNSEIEFLRPEDFLKKLQSYRPRKDLKTTGNDLLPTGNETDKKDLKSDEDKNDSPSLGSETDKKYLKPDYVNNDFKNFENEKQQPDDKLSMLENIKNNLRKLNSFSPQMKNSKDSFIMKYFPIHLETFNRSNVIQNPYMLKFYAGRKYINNATFADNS